MDEQTRKFLKGMDRLGGNNLQEALYAESLGLPVPFYAVEFLVMGVPLALNVPGPSLKATIQLPYMPTDGVEIERWKSKIWRVANDAFRRGPMHVHTQHQRYYDPREWGQYLNA